MKPGHIREVDLVTKIWKCDRCSSTFQRLDHLRRHGLTHDPAKEHTCSFCESTFGRGDALRRHWKSCKTRIDGGYDIPEPERGGKHKRACDSCAMLKKACNGTAPCTECVQRGKECTYQRVAEDRLPVQFTMQASSDRYSAAGASSDSSQPAWDLGASTLYPSMETHARRHSIHQAGFKDQRMTEPGDF